METILGSMIINELKKINEEINQKVGYECLIEYECEATNKIKEDKLTVKVYKDIDECNDQEYVFSFCSIWLTCINDICDIIKRTVEAEESDCVQTFNQLIEKSMCTMTFNQECEGILETRITLTDEDMKILDKVKNREGVLFKSLLYKGCKLGNLKVMPRSIVNSNYEEEDRFFEICIALGGHKEEPLIKTSGELKYVVVKEDVEKTLMGEHLLANTKGGRKIKVTIAAEA